MYCLASDNRIEKSQEVYPPSSTVYDDLIPIYVKDLYWI